MPPTAKFKLKGYIGGLEAKGGTDFEEGLEKAFEVLQDSGGDAATSSGCHRAILFMTDGQARASQQQRGAAQRRSGHHTQ